MIFSLKWFLYSFTKTKTSKQIIMYQVILYLFDRTGKQSFFYFFIWKYLPYNIKLRIKTRKALLPKTRERCKLETWIRSQDLRLIAMFPSVNCPLQKKYNPFQLKTKFCRKISKLKDSYKLENCCVGSKFASCCLLSFPEQKNLNFTNNNQFGL